MSRVDSASDAASSVGGASDAGSEAGRSDAGSQGGDQQADLLKESKFSLKVSTNLVQLLLVQQASIQSDKAIPGALRHNCPFLLLQAAIFGVVYSLKRLQLDRDFRLGVPTLFLEFLQWLILIFGPEWDWDINWSNRYAK